MPQAISADERLLASFPRNSREEVRIVSKTIGNRECLDVRIWYPDAVDGEFRPGKGLTLVRAKLPEFREALNLAAAQLEECEATNA